MDDLLDSRNPLNSPDSPDALKAQRWLRAAVGTLALLAILFSATAVIVKEGEAVLITRFGRPLRAATSPGLHWKLPWPIDGTVALDRRRVYETGQAEMLPRDKKNIIARTFVVWRVGDPLTFSQALGSEGSAEGKLDGPLTNAAIGTLGGHDLSALVSTTPSDLQFDEIESQLLASSAPTALRNYGVAIDQIHLERITRPEKEYRADPGVVRERLYRDAVEKAINVAGGVRWVPSPEGSSYHGFRITVGPNSSVTAVYGESGRTGEP